jgi:hypothetical protein
MTSFDRPARVSLVLAAGIALAACTSTGAGGSAPVVPATASPVTSAAVSPSATPASAVTPAPSTPETASPSVEPGSTEFVPPAPLCPSPVKAVEAPMITVAVGSMTPVAAAQGSSTVQTCSTVASADRPAAVPAKPIAAKAGDIVHFAVAKGWSIAAWQWAQQAKAGGQPNPSPTQSTSGSPSEVEVVVQGKGDVLLGVDMWCIGADGHAFAQVGAVTWLRIP